MESVSSDVRNRELELAILTSLVESPEPVGAVALSLQLQRRLGVSQATIGRKLQEMDVRGVTRRSGFKGRELTDSGRAYLQELVTATALAKRSEAFLRTLNVDDGGHLLQVLEARRALEKETARLATMRMAPADVEMLQQIIASQNQALGQGEPGTYQNFRFHDSIARLARNEVLLHAFHLVQTQSQLTLMIGAIREVVGGVLVQDHQEIVDAMRAGQPDAAERAMANHIDRIMADVRRYFGLADE